MKPCLERLPSPFGRGAGGEGERLGNCPPPVILALREFGTTFRCDPLSVTIPKKNTAASVPGTERLSSTKSFGYRYAARRQILQVMTPEAGQPTDLSTAARRCLIAVVIYGVVGIAITFALVNESTSQVETWLRERFPASRADAFAGMNRLMNPWVVSLWICWSALLPMCWIFRRYVSIGVLIASPVMPTVTHLLFGFDFADPNFVVLFGVLTIGMFVGAISGTVLSVLPRRWHVFTMRRTPSRGG